MNETARHLVIALRLHARWCRANGLSVPDGLEELALFLLASGGLGRTTVDSDSGTDHDGFMSLTLRYREVGDRLGISERSVRRLVAAGELPAVDVAGTRRIRVEDLQRYVAELPAAEIRREVRADDEEIVR